MIVKKRQEDLMSENPEDWEINIEKTEDPEELEPDFAHFEIMNYPADTTLNGYKEQMDNKQLVIPKFQRKFIWDQVRASKLIESFLLGLPVPGVFLFKERNSPQYLVIDGNQRINTVVSFFKGLIKDRKFKLKGVSSKWEGKSYEDLNEDEQFKLSTAVMRATIIQQLNPKDQSSIYYIFERLNTGGVNLNPMEVRMCVSEGSFTELLKELNTLLGWRKLIQRPKENPRARDIELILRAFALHERSDEYDKPMKKFLNDYIGDNKSKDEICIEEKRLLFSKAIEKIKELEKPFHLKGKLNYAVLDSILVALMDSPLTENQEIKDAYQALVKKDDYIEATSKNTSDKSEITKRIQITKSIFRVS